MPEALDAALMAELSGLIADAAGCAVQEVRPEGLLVGYGIDSVRAVELLDEAGERFGVTFDERDLATVRTVADVARRIAAKRAAQPAAARVAGGRS